MLTLSEETLKKVLEKELKIPVRVVVENKVPDIDPLAKDDLDFYNKLKPGSRRTAWLKGRVALKKLLSGFNKNLDTTLLSFPNPFYTLTHSGDYAIALGTKIKKIKGIGVDFETWRKIKPETARFFLTPDEQKWVLKLEKQSQAGNLLRLWTTKEALYKAYPENKKTVLANYVLENPEITKGKAFFKNDPRIRFSYCSIELREGHFTAAICH